MQESCTSKVERVFDGVPALESRYFEQPRHRRLIGSVDAPGYLGNQ